MVRKEKVFEKLKDFSKGLSSEETRDSDFGFGANEIAKELGFDRSNVSRDLNVLVGEKRVAKIKGKPVKFIDRENLERLSGLVFSNQELVFDSWQSLSKQPPNDFSFRDLVGEDGSLRIAIQQAKASVLYPPNGLNVLLTGETGVGKTTFAELIYEYAKEKEQLKKKGKFIAFNCSEYADNPQLLLDQLFGHVKGAYTGAEQEKRGLIEEAEGGILLLDEIHRLAPEGQEMLFMFIDKGRFRRLGESENTRTANVMLIAATTEDPTSVLLKAFIRRFPMIIKLPPLRERPIKERYRLIKDFFLIEAREIGIPIEVDSEVIELLLSYPCPSNVGQLRADIQLLCARGFLDFTTEDKSEIYIDGSMLPTHISEFKEGSPLVSASIDSLIRKRDSLYFSDDNDSPNLPHERNRYYRLLEKYRRQIENDENTEKVSRDIKHEIDLYIDEVMDTNEQNRKDKIYGIVDKVVYDEVESVLAEVLGEDGWDVTLAIALAMHISSSDGKSEVSIPDQTVLDGTDVPEMRIALLLNEKLGVDVDPAEVRFISRLLFDKESERNKMDSDLVGDRAAETDRIAGASNDDEADRTNSAKGGYLKISVRESQVDEMVDAIKFAFGDIDVEFVSEIDEAKRILTTCITGEGTAVKVAERIRNEMPQLIEAGIEVTPIDFKRENIDDEARHYSAGTIAVVGSVDLKLEGIPFIPLEEFVIGDGMKELRMIVDGNSGVNEDKSKQCIFKESEKAKVLDMLHDSTLFIDADKVFAEADASFQSLMIERDAGKLKSLEVRYILHMACMLERLLQKLPIDYPDIEKSKADNSERYAHVRKSIQNIELAFNVEIPDAEIGFLIDLIYTQ